MTQDKWHMLCTAWFPRFKDPFGGLQLHNMSEKRPKNGERVSRQTIWAQRRPLVGEWSGIVLSDSDLKCLSACSFTLCSALLCPAAPLPFVSASGLMLLLMLRSFYNFFTVQHLHFSVVYFAACIIMIALICMWNAHPKVPLSISVLPSAHKSYSVVLIVFVFLMLSLIL